MTASPFDDVGEFHRKFDLPSVPRQRKLYTSEMTPQSTPSNAENLHNKELMDFRVAFIEEELQELKDALAAGDLVEVADALIDLEYVTHGFMHVLGLPHNELWDDVQRANMAKQRAASDGSDSKRGSAYDVVKPEGWRGPAGRDILKRHGFDV